MAAPPFSRHGCRGTQQSYKIGWDAGAIQYAVSIMWFYVDLHGVVDLYGVVDLHGVVHHLQVSGVEDHTPFVAMVDPGSSVLLPLSCQRSSRQWRCNLKLHQMRISIYKTRWIQVKITDSLFNCSFNCLLQNSYFFHSQINLFWWIHFEKYISSLVILRKTNLLEELRKGCQGWGALWGADVPLPLPSTRRAVVTPSNCWCSTWKK